MPISLPKPIAAYFAADAADRDAVANFFTLDAVVIDEKQTHRGRDAVARWKAETSAKYDYVSEPVTGNFPGSPVNLRYALMLEGDAIARLEIAA